MQALEICYIRLCHKAELRTALSVSNPRHPHAPEHQLDASHDPASGRLPPTSALSSTASDPASGKLPPTSAPSSTASDQHVVKPVQRQASNPVLASSSMPEATGASSQAEAAAGAPSLAGSQEAIAQSDHGRRTELFRLSQFDYCCMHSPFHKLVRKAFARLTHIDQLRQHNPPSYQSTASQKQVSSSKGLCLRAPAVPAGNPLIKMNAYLIKCACSVIMHACCTYHVPSMKHAQHH